MGAFVVIIVTMLVAIWMAMAPYGQDWGQVDRAPGRVAVQSIAANMMEFHQAALRFVSQNVNKSPVSTQWAFTYLNQAAVRCAPYASATYPANSASGSCAAPVTELVMPSYMSEAAPAHDWVVCYVSGTPNKLVTYSRSGENPGGYTPAEIAAAFADYNISNNYDNWYWGVTTSGPSLTYPTTITLPTDCTSAPASAVAVGVVAIATVIN